MSKKEEMCVGAQKEMTDIYLARCLRQTHRRTFPRAPHSVCLSPGPRNVGIEGNLTQVMDIQT